jgi:hypothetical protein
MPFKLLRDPHSGGRCGPPYPEGGGHRRMIIKRNYELKFLLLQI